MNKEELVNTIQKELDFTKNLLSKITDEISKDDINTVRIAELWENIEVLVLIVGLNINKYKEEI